MTKVYSQTHSMRIKLTIKNVSTSHKQGKWRSQFSMCRLWWHEASLVRPVRRQTTESHWPITTFPMSYHENWKKKRNRFNNKDISVSWPNFFVFSSFNALADVIFGPGTAPPWSLSLFLFSFFFFFFLNFFFKHTEKSLGWKRPTFWKGDLYNGRLCLQPDIEHWESSYSNGGAHHGDSG